MAEITTTIRGYKIYLDTDVDGTGSTTCHVSKGRHNASIELIDSFGGFDDGEEGQEVAQSTIDAIRSWADRNGY